MVLQGYPRGTPGSKQNMVESKNITNKSCYIQSPNLNMVRSRFLDTKFDGFCRFEHNLLGSQNFVLNIDLSPNMLLFGAKKAKD